MSSGWFVSQRSRNAIAGLLRYLRSHGVGIFVAYRLALAALVVVAWLGLWDR